MPKTRQATNPKSGVVVQCHIPTGFVAQKKRRFTSAISLRHTAMRKSLVSRHPQNPVAGIIAEIPTEPLAAQVQRGLHTAHEVSQKRQTFWPAAEFALAVDMASRADYLQIATPLFCARLDIRQ